MKKIIGLLTIITMLSNSALAGITNEEVNSSHRNMISKTFNDFRYKMTVELDPSDTQYKAKAMEDFKNRMADLQAKGISSEEVMDYMRSSVLDSSTRADFDLMLSSLNLDKVSSEEAGNLAMRFMAAKYQQGASYSGGGRANYKAALIVIGVIIVGVVTYLVIKHCKDQRSKTVTDTVTRTNTQTQTNTETQTTTDTVTTTEVQTNTQTVTNVETINNTETVTNYNTVVTTDTVTSVQTVTNYNTITNFETLTNTVTDTITNTLTDTITNTVTNTCTDTHTNTDYGWCCNTVSGHVVPASPTGCDHGEALEFVLYPELCIKLGPPDHGFN